MNLLGLIWLQLGRRSSWDAEDLDAKMIQASGARLLVAPPSTPPPKPLPRSVGAFRDRRGRRTAHLQIQQPGGLRTAEWPSN